MKPAFGPAPAEPTWERPRRPAEPEPPRWPWVALWTVLACVAAGGWFAFAPESDRAVDATTSAAEPGLAPVTDEERGPAEGFAILHASWGSVDETIPPPPPEPQNPTEWQLRERAFQEMGRERWKGTELFVRRDPR